jgi:hypothetical protein
MSVDLFGDGTCPGNQVVGAAGPGQTVQQPNVTPPQAEKAAVLLTCPPQTTPQIMSA